MRGKYLDFESVMDNGYSYKCINIIRVRTLNRREFRQFVTDVEEQDGELLQHCEIRWLSKDKVFQIFCL